VEQRHNSATQTGASSEVPPQMTATASGSAAGPPQSPGSTSCTLVDQSTTLTCTICYGNHRAEKQPHHACGACHGDSTVRSSKEHQMNETGRNGGRASYQGTLVPEPKCGPQPNLRRQAEWDDMDSSHHDRRQLRSALGVRWPPDKISNEELCSVYTKTGVSDSESPSPNRPGPT
jgi:hypothetical protein